MSAQPAPAPSNPWLKGPPQQLKAAAASVPSSENSPKPGEANVQAGQATGGQSQPVGLNAFRLQQRIARAHHHLPTDELQVHAYQLGVAQQFALAAMQAGVDLATYQAQVAMSYGIDPRVLSAVPEPGAPITGQEPMIGLTLVRDDQAYTHIELLSRYPQLAPINLTPVDLEPRRAHYFLATCMERQVHAGLKYGFWLIPGEGAAAMNRVFADMHGIGPIYLVFASTDSVAFSGIAQMVGPTSPVKPEEPEGMHRFPIRWVFCKNIPFGHMSHVTLRPTSREAEEQRKIHGGLQPMKQNDGNRALAFFANYPPGVSVLMDFKYYDEAEVRGAQVESGEAAIRAASKQFLYQQQGQQYTRGPPRGEGNHYGGGRGRGGYHGGANLNPNNNPSAFPTIKESASGVQPQQQQESGGGNASHHHHGPSRGGHRSFEGGRGGGRGGPRREGGSASRQIVTADEERVNLQTKFVFEPVKKEKQSRRRRNRQQEYEDEGEYDEAAQQEQYESAPQEGQEEEPYEEVEQ